LISSEKIIINGLNLFKKANILAGKR